MPIFYSILKMASKSGAYPVVAKQTLYISKYFKKVVLYSVSFLVYCPTTTITACVHVTTSHPRVHNQWSLNLRLCNKFSSYPDLQTTDVFLGAVQCVRGLNSLKWSRFCCLRTRVMYLWLGMSRASWIFYNSISALKQIA